VRSGAEPNGRVFVTFFVTAASAGFRDPSIPPNLSLSPRFLNVLGPLKQLRRSSSQRLRHPLHGIERGVLPSPRVGNLLHGIGAQSRSLGQLRVGERFAGWMFVPLNCSAEAYSQAGHSATSWGIASTPHLLYFVESRLRGRFAATVLLLGRGVHPELSSTGTANSLLASESDLNPLPSGSSPAQSLSSD